MKIYAVIRDDKMCFVDLHRYRVASFLIPAANLLNNDNPLANKQWIALTKDIDKLETGKSIEYGDCKIICDEIDNEIFIQLVAHEVMGGADGGYSAAD